MLVSHLLANRLRTHGVDVVFGLLSDDIIELVVALRQVGIEYCTARHETQAVAMAEGYSFATNELGVAAVGRGGASTNALTGAIYAGRTGSKVLLVLGDEPIGSAPINSPGPDIKRLGGLGASAVFGAAGLRTFPVIGPGLACPMLAEAVGYAESGHAAVLLLPTSVQSADVDADPAAPLEVPLRPRRPETGTTEALEAAVTVLARSRHVLVVAGWGVHVADARVAVLALAERLGAVIATTLKGKDLFRGNPYAVGVLGSFSDSATRRLVAQADCVLVIGAGLNLFTTSHGLALPPVPIVQIDTDRSHIGRWSNADVALVGDARLVAEQLYDALPPPNEGEGGFRTAATRDVIAAFDHKQDFEDVSRSRNVDPRSLALVLDDVLPRERTIVYDAGNFLGVVPYLSATGPDRIKMTSDSGAIGLGIGTAIGAARGRRETTTVLVIGDGGLLMTLGELETVARESLPIVILVMNDRAYGAERHFLQLRGHATSTAMFPEVDYASLADQLGIESVTVASLDDAKRLGPRMTRRDAPILVDCLINPAVQAPFLLELDALGRRQ
jgi:thiamine pyrophosphate-dependent acetolactate synthase large subunit-like protein